MGPYRKLLMVSALTLGNMTPGPDIGPWRKGSGLGGAYEAGWRAPVWRKYQAIAAILSGKIIRTDEWPRQAGRACIRRRSGSMTANVS